MSDQLIAVSDPGKQHGSADAERAGEVLHVDAVPGKIPLTREIERVHQAAARDLARGQVP
ncbi:hypothetical protein OG357_04300 [Streptomyces sp. NBC_01255]|uniref:hypothetical protein n=1 Tax=Streptomyces sp. NBC_01255 TaxID=2903798 RepID=UPI002E3806D1|nr:hypothetical protein [Streptomyces sp. NBC_01255]